LVGGQFNPTSQYMELEQQVTTFIENNSRIQWLRDGNDNILANEYAKCQFTVYPSIEEGFGLPILESLWYGRPCICRNSSAMVEAAAGGGCLTVETADVDKLAAAMILLAKDAELRARLGREAVTRHIKTWSEYTCEILHHLAKRTAGYKG
jgi:glycosyltransferase involved in cell wall biosynthesis